MQTYRRNFLPARGWVRKNNADLWWINPVGFIAFIIMPTFVLSIIYGAPVMSMFGSLNFLSISFLWTGVGCLSALMAGLFGGASLSSSFLVARRGWDERHLISAIRILLIVSLLAHVMLLGTVMAQPDLWASALSGSRGAASQMNRELSRIPGVTTLTQLYLLGVPLYVVYPFLFRRRLPQGIQRIFLALVVFVVFRAFLASERFALIELAVCYFLPKIACSPRKDIYGYLPPFAIFSVFLMFAVLEYFRTWAAYRAMYSSYLEFISYRFLGYLCTSTNNAAGVLSNFGPMGEPWFTGRWIQRLTLLLFPDNAATGSGLSLFFKTYGNAEFNNPSGIFSPILDYGVGIGILVWVLIGTVGGLLYFPFRQMQPLGVLIYPSFFLGLTVITQSFYWGDPRYTPVIVLSIPVFMYITKRQHGISPVRK